MRMWKNIKNGHLLGIQRNMMVHLYLSIPIQMIPMSMFLRLSALYKLLRQVGKRVLSTRFFKTFLGGTLFDRMDFGQAREIRLKIWKFLAKYLKPDNPL